MCSRSDACPAGTAGTNDVIPSSAPPAPPFSLLFAPPVIAPFRAFSLPVIAPFRAFSLLLTLAIAPFRSFSRPHYIWVKFEAYSPQRKVGCLPATAAHRAAHLRRTFGVTFGVLGSLCARIGEENLRQ